MELDSADPYRVRALLYASMQVRGRTLKELENPMSLPGIGPSIATTIKEFLLRGSSTRLENLSEKWPVEILALTQVQGVGPKTAVALYEQGITSFDELLKKAKAGELSTKLAANVLASESKLRRIPIEVALEVAEPIKEVLLRAGAQRLEVCGSIRRHSPTCKDIDIIVEPLEEASGLVKKEFEALGTVLWSGPVKSSIFVTSGETQIQCDLWLVKGWHWGSALNYTTGSKHHNERLRGMLKNRGMRLNEYGIYMPLEGVDLSSRKISYGPSDATANGEVVARRLGGEKEEDVYNILGMTYVHPSQRTD
jgi:DNA polymerase (family 10)